MRVLLFGLLFLFALSFSLWFCHNNNWFFTAVLSFKMMQNQYNLKMYQEMKDKNEIRKGIEAGRKFRKIHEEIDKINKNMN